MKSFLPIILFLPVFCFINGCNNSDNSGSLEYSYEDQKDDSTGFQLLQISEDSVGKEQIKKDSLTAISVEKLGGVSLISIDKESKCNLIKGYYMLNKIITDSSDLALISHYLCSSLFKSIKREENCQWPVMSAAYLYMNEKGFNNTEVIASCTITPRDYEGDVLVNTCTLSKYKNRKNKK